MAGEFGRTPKISHLPQHYKLPGRDHWGAVQTVFFAGGGVQGGTVIGSSDKIGAYPAADPQTPENMAATIYESLGIPPIAVWTRRARPAAPRLLRRADHRAGLIRTRRARFQSCAKIEVIDRSSRDGTGRRAHDALCLPWSIGLYTNP